MSLSYDFLNTSRLLIFELFEEMIRLILTAYDTTPPPPPPVGNKSQTESYAQSWNHSQAQLPKSPVQPLHPK